MPTLQGGDVTIKIHTSSPTLTLDLEMQTASDYAAMVLDEATRPTFIADQVPIYVPTGRGLEARWYEVGAAYFDAEHNDYVTIAKILMRANEHDQRLAVQQVQCVTDHGWRFITDPDRLAQLLPTSRPGPALPVPPKPEPLVAREIKV